jgi:hypothetical protein
MKANLSAEVKDYFKKMKLADIKSIKGGFIQLKSYNFDYISKKEGFVLNIFELDYHGGECDIINQPRDVNSMEEVKKLLNTGLFVIEKYEIKALIASGPIKKFKFENENIFEKLSQSPKKIKRPSLTDDIFDSSFRESQLSLSQQEKKEVNDFTNVCLRKSCDDFLIFNLQKSRIGFIARTSLDFVEAELCMKVKNVIDNTKEVKFLVINSYIRTLNDLKQRLCHLKLLFIKIILILKDCGGLYDLFKSLANNPKIYKKLVNTTKTYEIFEPKTKKYNLLLENKKNPHTRPVIGIPHTRPVKKVHDTKMVVDFLTSGVTAVNNKKMAVNDDKETRLNDHKNKDSKENFVFYNQKPFKKRPLEKSVNEIFIDKHSIKRPMIETQCKDINKDNKTILVKENNMVPKSIDSPTKLKTQINIKKFSQDDSPEIDMNSVVDIETGEGFISTFPSTFSSSYESDQDEEEKGDSKGISNLFIEETCGLTDIQFFVKETMLDLALIIIDDLKKRKTRYSKK